MDLAWIAVALGDVLRLRRIVVLRIVVGRRSWRDGQVAFPAARVSTLKLYKTRSHTTWCHQGTQQLVDCQCA